MLNSKKSISSLTAKVAEVAKSVKSTFTEPKRFVNGDGTIAESHNSYKEFKTDIIKSAGYGW